MYSASGCDTNEKILNTVIFLNLTPKEVRNGKN